jgi:hypothetical protein
VKRGSRKVITVTPEGAYRGDVKYHDDVMQRWHAEVVPFSKTVQRASTAAAA